MMLLRSLTQGVTEVTGHTCLLPAVPLETGMHGVVSFPSPPNPLCASPGISQKFQLILTLAVELEQTLQVIFKSHKSSLYLRLPQSLGSLLVHQAYR